MACSADLCNHMQYIRQLLALCSSVVNAYTQCKKEMIRFQSSVGNKIINGFPWHSAIIIVDTCIIVLISRLAMGNVITQAHHFIYLLCTANQNSKLCKQLKMHCQFTISSQLKLDNCGSWYLSFCSFLSGFQSHKTWMSLKELWLFILILCGCS